MRIEEKTIGGFKYRMEQVGMETGEQIVLRLGRPVAALFSRVAAAAAKGGPTEVSMEQLAATGLEPLLQALTGKDLRYVRKKLVAQTVVWLPDGNKMREWPLAEHYDDHFRGRYVEALEFFRWGLSMNRFFGSALDRLDAMLAARAKALQSSSPPERAAVGGSGDSSSRSTDARA